MPWCGHVTFANGNGSVRLLDAHIDTFCLLFIGEMAGPFGSVRAGPKPRRGAVRRGGRQCDRRRRRRWLVV